MVYGPHDCGRNKYIFLYLVELTLTVTVIGYATRIISINDTTQKMPYIIQSSFIVLAPAFFAATVYMILGRVIAYVNSPHLSFIPHRRLTTIFVLGDLLSFVIQGSGAGLLAMPSLISSNTASLIVVGGLIIQLIFFGLFFAALIVFDMRCRRQGLPKRMVPDDGSSKLHWHTVIVALYIASTLISIRCIFRAIEFAMGFDGYLQAHEVFFYVFDSLPMVVTMGIFNIIIPGKALKGEMVEVEDVELRLRK